MIPSTNITKEEFRKLELPIGVIFKDIPTGTNLKVVATCCGSHMCDDCFYKDTECLPNGKWANAPLCSWVDRNDGQNVKFVKVSGDPDESEIPTSQSMAKNTIKEYLENNYPDSYLFDDLDDAIIGVSTSDNIVYEFDKIIQILMERDGMTYEEAVEYFDHNIDRVLPYMADGFPVIMKNIEI